MSSKNASGISKKVRQPGPKPEHIAIEGDWEDAVKKALKKPPPPKPDTKKPPHHGGGSKS
jgi:hypothetical protein